MKRTATSVIALALAASLCLLSGCTLPTRDSIAKAKNSPEPTSAAESTPTPAPTPTPEPETTLATVLVDNLSVLCFTLQKGETVCVLSEVDEYYLCQIEGKKVYIEKRFVSLPSESFTEWTGYAVDELSIFSDAYLSGNAFASANKGTVITVLQEMGDCSMIRTEDGTEGFALTSMVSLTNPNAYYNSGSSGSADGGDIHLSAFSQIDIQFAFLDSTSALPCDGTILADGVEAYYCFYYRGDVINVINTEGDRANILHFGTVYSVPQKLIRDNETPSYSAWEGYAQKNAVMFGDYRMKTASEDIPLNSTIVVLEQFEDGYYVEFGGKRGYMPTESVGTEEDTSSAYSGWSGGGGSSSGESWTAPQL